MSGWKGVAFAAWVAVAAGGSAGAVDLPPAPQLPAPGPSAAEFSGWYLRGDVGVGFNEAPKLRLTPGSLTPAAPSGYVFPYAYPSFRDTTLSASGMIDAGVGYRFNEWLRLDSTLEYRGGANLNATTPLPAQYAGFRADVSSFVGLVNGYVDLPGLWGVTPFVGAAAGLSDNIVSGGGSKASFAWALMAGLGYDISPNLRLELGYRYLNLGSIETGGSSYQISSRHTLASNDIRFGLIWTLGEPAAPPAPVVARD